MSESAQRPSQVLHDIELSSVNSDKQKLVKANNSSSGSIWALCSSKLGISGIVSFIAANIVLWVCLALYVFNSPSSSDDDTSTAVSTFQTIFPFNFAITGIRQDTNNNVIITGGTENSTGWIYHGPLSNFPTTADSSSMYLYFWPEFPNQTTNATTLYSCNTHYFDSRIPEGNLTAVGSYNYKQSPITKSFLFKGNFYGVGEYSQIVIPPQPFVNETTGKNSTREVGHTLAHSVMGDLVVGNWYYADDHYRGHVFIMNMVTGEITTVDEGTEDGISVTMYGVWQNGGENSTHYTIAGGIYLAKDETLEYGFIQTYDSLTQRLGPMVKYLYQNDSSYSTHFQGIAGVEGGYSLSATQSRQGKTTASYCYIPYDSSTGTFGDATWIHVNNTVLPDTITSGNTIIDYSVLGAYVPSEGSGYAASFIADVSSILF